METSKNLIGAIVGFVLMLLSIYIIVWVAGKAWKKGGMSA